MAELKYRLVKRTKAENIIIHGLGLSDQRQNLDKIADRLNKRFPNRNYKVETIRQTEKAIYLLKEKLCRK
jgi:hypothetical protein